jgi:hypothetical protein
MSSVFITNFAISKAIYIFLKTLNLNIIFFIITIWLFIYIITLKKISLKGFSI